MENKFVEMEGKGKDSPGDIPAETAEQTNAGERPNFTDDPSERYSQHPASSSSNPEAEGSLSPAKQVPGTGGRVDEARCLEESVDALQGKGKGRVKPRSFLNPDAKSKIRMTKDRGDTKEEGRVRDSNSWSEVEDMLSDSEPSVGTDNTDSDSWDGNNNNGDEKASASGARGSGGGSRGRRERKERKEREDLLLDFDQIFEIGDVDTTPSPDEELEENRSSRDFGGVGRNRRGRDGVGTVDTTSSSDDDSEEQRNRRRSRALREYGYRVGAVENDYDGDESVSEDDASGGHRGCEEGGEGEDQGAEEGEGEGQGAEEGGGEGQGAEEGGGEGQGAEEGGGEDRGAEERRGEGGERVDLGAEDQAAEEGGGGNQGAQDRAVEEGGGEDERAQDRRGEDRGREYRRREVPGGEDPRGGEEVVADVGHGEMERAR